MNTKSKNLVHTILTTICLGGCLFALQGCVVVKPYQRATLTKRTMVTTQTPGESRFNQHARGSREGSDGGNGEAGGGCGCN